MGNQTQTTTLAINSTADLSGVKATEKELTLYGDKLRQIKAEMKDLGGSSSLGDRAASQYLGKMRAAARTADREKINAAVDSVGGENTGALEKIKGAFGRGSGIDETFKMLKGGGALIGFSLVGESLANASAKMKELSKDWNNLSNSDRLAKMLESLPFGIGAFATAGRNLREAFTGEEAQLEAITETTQLQDQLMTMRIQHIREQNKQLEDQGALLRKIGNETKLLGMAGSGATLTQKDQAIRERQEEAARKVREAQTKLGTYQTDTPEVKAAQAKLDEVNRWLTSLTPDKMGTRILHGNEGVAQQYKDKLGERAAAERVIAEGRKGRTEAQTELKDAQDAQNKIQQEGEKESVEFYRDYKQNLKQLDAAADAERLQAMGRSADAEVTRLKESLRRQQEQREHDEKNGASFFGLKTQQKEIDNTQQKLAEAERVAGRDREIYEWDQGKLLTEIKAATDASALRQQGKFAAATIAQLKAAHANRMEELDWEEKEEIRKHKDQPEIVAAIKKRYEAQRGLDQKKLDNESKSAGIDEFQTYQRLRDMKIDFGARMAERGKPTYTFNADTVDAGTTGTNEMFKAKQGQDRQALDMQKEMRGFQREMRDAMLAIQQKMLSLNLGAG